MPKKLTDRQQRIILGALVVALVAFGIYLYLANNDDGDDEDAAQEDQAAETTAPTPITVTDEDELEFFDWLPFTEEEFLAAAVTAREFAAAYGTYDSSEAEEEYYERMDVWASEDFADVLEQTSGAGALRSELEDSETVSEGYAETRSIRYFDDDSIVFIVDAQSITEDSEGARESFGEFAITVVPEGDEWRVHDFQPAEAGDFGEE